MGFSLKKAFKKATGFVSKVSKGATGVLKFGRKLSSKVLNSGIVKSVSSFIPLGERLRSSADKLVTTGLSKASSAEAQMKSAANGLMDTSLMKKATSVTKSDRALFGAVMDKMNAQNSGQMGESGGSGISGPGSDMGQQFEKSARTMYSTDDNQNQKTTMLDKLKQFYANNKTLCLVLGGVIVIGIVGAVWYFKKRRR